MSASRFAAILLLVLASAGALAAPSACQSHYAGGAAPDIRNARMQPRARELCFEAFAVMHSGLTRTPLWSAEHLTRGSVSAARSQVRVNNFHPDPRLPAGERAELSDYARSGYDRGHIAPSGDMPSPEAQAQSFSLANMIPQDATLNRHLWEGIETSVRNLAQRRGALYVITGPLYEGDQVKVLKGRVYVPTSVFKLVYDPASRAAGAYVAPNDASGRFERVSLAELERRAAIAFLPGQPVADRHAAMDLPAPRERGRRGGSDAPLTAPGDETLASAGVKAARFLQSLMR